nr:uncharacterized protein LOC129264655 [Lytechinus pictus]
MRECACTCPHICWPWCVYRTYGQRAEMQTLEDEGSVGCGQATYYQTQAFGRWIAKCGNATMNFLMGLFQRGSYYIPHDEDYCISRKSMEQSAFKSISIDHLDDADDAIVGAITFANNAAVDKRMSKSSDSLSGGLTQRRSRSTSLGEKDADSAYEEGPSATSARTKSELEVELRRLTHQLNMVRKDVFHDLSIFFNVNAILEIGI